MAVPGRFNVFDYKGATVIADYGHNPDAIKALVQAVTNLPAQRRSVVISGAGDRRDCDIRDQTAILGEAFDDVILYQDAAQRGRADGEVLALLRQGLDGARRTSHIEEIRGEFTAIDAAIEAVIAANPDKVEEVKAKPKLAAWFVGQVMKQTGGKANPTAVNAALKTRLNLPDEG